MLIVFCKIFSANPDKYLQEKLKRIVSRNPGLAAQYDDTWIEAQAGSIVSSLGKASVPVALSDSFYPSRLSKQRRLKRGSAAPSSRCYAIRRSPPVKRFKRIFSRF